jgi:hypothetical protein
MHGSKMIELPHIMIYQVRRMGMAKCVGVDKQQAQAETIADNSLSLGRGLSKRNVLHFPQGYGYTHQSAGH